jgi:hypothetical protein
MTGWSAPAARTSFLIFTEEWTRLPITPTCKIEPVKPKIAWKLSTSYQLGLSLQMKQGIPTVPVIVTMKGNRNSKYPFETTSA